MSNTSAMLENLDQIPWAEFEHAGGSAGDIPELLRELPSADSDRADEIVGTFFCNIWHQGTVYEATAYAVPFLTEIVLNRGTPARSSLLYLLSRLAFGNSFHDVHQSLPWNAEKRDDPEFKALIAKELSWVRAAHEAVVAEVPRYLGLFEDEDESVRLLAVYLTALMAPEREEVAPALLGHLELEWSDAVRASALFGLGYCKREPALVETLWAHLNCESGLLCFAAASSLARLLRSEAPDEVLATLVHAIAHPSELEEAYAGQPWEDEGVAADAGRMLLWLGEGGRPDLSSVINALRECNYPMAAQSLLQTLFAFRFRRFSPDSPPQWANLDDEQRDILRTAAGNPAIWIFYNTREVLKSVGLPSEYKEFHAFVGNPVSIEPSTEEKMAQLKARREAKH